MSERNSFTIFEDWQGEIIDLNEDTKTFDARMIPTLVSIKKEAVFTFQLDAVDELMRDRIRVGGTFRWINGNYDGESIDIFDVDLAPGQVPVTKPSLPRLEDLYKK